MLIASLQFVLAVARLLEEPSRLRRRPSRAGAPVAAPAQGTATVSRAAGLPGASVGPRFILAPRPVPLCGVVWVHVGWCGLCGFTWGGVRSRGVVWVHMGWYGFTWCWCGVVWVHVGLCGFTRVCSAATALRPPPSQGPSPRHLVDFCKASQQVFKKMTLWLMELKISN